MVEEAKKVSGDYCQLPRSVVPAQWATVSFFHPFFLVFSWISYIISSVIPASTRQYLSHSR
jgi:hypothetical protein